MHTYGFGIAAGGNPRVLATEWPDLQTMTLHPSDSSRQTELTQLKNLGPTIIRKLADVGIHTPADLRRVGPVNAYLAMQKKSAQNLPVCYYLYSLEGALNGRHWNDLPAERKKELLRAIGRKG